MIIDERSHMTRHTILRTSIIAFGLAMSAIRPASAQKQIPIRTLGQVEATSIERVGFVSGVHELSDGTVIVNDAGKRRLIAFDRTLGVARILADTGAGSKLQYGGRSTGIIPYAGDSTLLVDAVGRAFLVIDGKGNVGRVMSAPRPNDVTSMTNAGLGAPGFDRQGRLIYRTMLMPAFKAPVVGKPYTPPSMPDSAPLLRADFDKRTADTIAWLRTAVMKVNSTPLSTGGVVLTPIFSPISVVDDWTVLPDGSVAILRGADYHLDWVDPAGARSSSPKMPFDWKRLSDEDKAAIIDSTRKLLERQQQRPGSGNASITAGPGGHAGAGIPTGHSMTIMPIGGDDGGPQPKMTTPPVSQIAQLVEPSELPDYYPSVLQAGEMRADLDGRVWILPSTSSQAGRGLLYDVVDRRGELVERIRLPEGRALEGFGANGVVYLTSHGPDGTRLERARINR
jgi:hypothetical protein